MTARLGCHACRTSPWLVRALEEQLLPTRLSAEVAAEEGKLVDRREECCDVDRAFIKARVEAQLRVVRIIS